MHAQVLYYYRTGITMLQAQGYVPGKTLFGFGYDFRYAPQGTRPLLN